MQCTCVAGVTCLACRLYVDIYHAQKRLLAAIRNGRILAARQALRELEDE